MLSLKSILQDKNNIFIEISEFKYENINTKWHQCHIKYLFKFL